MTTDAAELRSLLHVLRRHLDDGHTIRPGSDLHGQIQTAAPTGKDAAVAHYHDLCAAARGELPVHPGVRLESGR